MAKRQERRCSITVSPSLQLQNEYTDWEKAIRNPLSARDATLQFLSDGHTASPLIKLGYMHSLRGGRTYFVHFKHRTVEDEYPQVGKRIVRINDPLTLT